MIDNIEQKPNPQHLNRLAAVQEGALTRGQLLRMGATEQWIYAMLQSGNLFEMDDDGAVYRHPAHDTHFDDFDRAVWFAQEPDAFPEERLGLDRTPHFILSGARALAIKHRAPGGGPVVFACENLPELRNLEHDFVVRTIRPGDWEWIRGVPLASRTLAIADMVLSHDDEDEIRHALLGAITSDDFAPARFLEVVGPAAESWGFDGTDGRDIIRRFLHGDIVSHHWTGAVTTINLRQNRLEMTSSMSIGGNSAPVP